MNYTQKLLAEGLINEVLMEGMLIYWITLSCVCHREFTAALFQYCVTNPVISDSHNSNWSLSSCSVNSLFQALLDSSSLYVEDEMWHFVKCDAEMWHRSQKNVFYKSRMLYVLYIYLYCFVFISGVGTLCK
jgi:hypothetical protein